MPVTLTKTITLTETTTFLVTVTPSALPPVTVPVPTTSTETFVSTVVTKSGRFSFSVHFLEPELTKIRVTYKTITTGTSVITVPVTLTKTLTFTSTKEIVKTLPPLPPVTVSVPTTATEIVVVTSKTKKGSYILHRGVIN